MASESTAALVREILDGRKDLFAELIGAFQSPVYNLALRMTGSAADTADLTQEIFLRAWVHLDRYDPRRPFFTWLYTLSLNLTRNHLRKAPKTISSSNVPDPGDADGGENPDTMPDPSETLFRKQSEAQIQTLLLQLPADQREALLLRFFGDLRYGEMADDLVVSQSAAKMRVSRGLERLRALLQNDADSIRDYPAFLPWGNWHSPQFNSFLTVPSLPSPPPILSYSPESPMSTLSTMFIQSTSSTRPIHQHRPTYRLRYSSNFVSPCDLFACISKHEPRFLHQCYCRSAPPLAGGGTAAGFPPVHHGRAAAAPRPAGTPCACRRRGFSQRRAGSFWLPSNPAELLLAGHGWRQIRFPRRMVACGGFAATAMLGLSYGIHSGPGLIATPAS